MWSNVAKGPVGEGVKLPPAENPYQREMQTALRVESKIIVTNDFIILIYYLGLK
jgi:hypothetical protein